MSMQPPSPPVITADTLVALLAQQEEHAVLDVREIGVHDAAGHILHSVPVPLSQLETRIVRLVPRRATPVVVYDGGDGEKLAARAAVRLQTLGYRDVSVLGNGVAGWRAAGLEAYNGVHVLSKAFGELVEHEYGTPHLSARELKQKLDAGEDVVVLDGRTLGEFEDFSIPGAFACPNAELPYRAHGLIASPDTLVVVNCAGRTRSIIGAQALINAGLENKVMALENGTMAWLEEGFPLASGIANPAPAPSARSLEKAGKSAQHLRERFGLRVADRATLDALVAEAAAHAVYLLDVRTRAEFEAGHLPGSVWAEGGQLVQATDGWIGTRNARTVLIDDADGVRAAITGSWLMQLGIDVCLYALDAASDTLELGAGSPLVACRVPAVPTITVEALRALDGRATVLDVSDSLAYAAGHVPGALFAIRARFADGLHRLPNDGLLVVTGLDPALTAFAAADLAELTQREVRLLEGGLAAWRAAGLPVETDGGTLHDAAEDVWPSPYRQPDRMAAFRRYLDWEIGLVEQVARDRTVSFRPRATA